jgi:hypothetical protein
VPLKKAELALPQLFVWGRISTLNGKDYLISYSPEALRAEEDKCFGTTLYYFSQDGIEWTDLAAIPEEKKFISSKMRTLLTGDPQNKFYWPPKPDDENDEGRLSREGAPSRYGSRYFKNTTQSSRDTNVCALSQDCAVKLVEHFRR